MELTSNYIQFKKQDKLLLWFIENKADILLLGSTFINTQDNKVEIINKDSSIFKIKCPSGDYGYHKDQILDNLKSGRYSDFRIYYDRDNIHILLNPIFNYYYNITSYPINYKNMINFFSGPNGIGKFLKELIGYATFDIEEIFNNYFNINKTFWKSVPKLPDECFKKSSQLNYKLLLI